MKEIDPITLITAIVIGSLSFVLLVRTLFPRRRTSPPIVHDNNYYATYTEHEEDEVSVRDTDQVHDDADANDLLSAKMKCLEWALGNNQQDPSKAIEVAEQYWDFIKYVKDGE